MVLPIRTRSSFLHYQSRQWHPTPVLFPGKSHGWRSLMGCSPWGHKDSDTTERLHFHFSISCIGEGSGNPLQCFCLENPRDGGAWWAAVYGVAQNQTGLKRISNSSSNSPSYQEYCTNVLASSIRGKTEEARRTTIPKSPDRKPQSQKAHQNEKTLDYIPDEGIK